MSGELRAQVAARVERHEPRLEHKYSFLRDTQLSYKARGIMMFIVEAFSGRDINMEDVHAHSLHDGRSAVQTGIKELVTHGYLKLKPLPSGQGWVWGRKYIITFDETMAQYPPSFYAKPSQSTQPRQGFVYIIQCGESFKIGCTANLKQRIKALGVTAPYPIFLRIIVPTDDMILTEWKLHQRFEGKRQQGEWFSLSEIDLATIRHEYTTIDPATLGAN
jgi:T5orf172 domain